MLALYITIPFAFIISFIALIVFIKSLKEGQYEDIEAPKYRIFFEDEPPKK
ncbi:MAG: cbb3-type cytochrome oxidase assembly protein CcoS [Leptospiraceae bacterium]|nr:cbb3-type cytochrome oxidase assembly protein CcoS [Leptospiraceae bacterium]